MIDIQITNERGRVPVTVIQVEGDIDSTTYKTFQEIILETITNGARHILVDLAHVPFMSSAGLRALHEAFNQLRKANNEINDDELRKSISTGGYKSPHLKLLNLSEQVKVGFETAGFDIYIQTFTDLKAAVDSF
ncbi:MAG: STAS domain-containing protein [Anaerolineales bacterium]|nr:STAS domain-containing protein [Anaerolineales bacterium]